MKPRFFLILTPFFTLLLSEIFFFQVKFFYWCLILINLIVGYSIYKVSGLSLKNKNLGRHLILPFFFLNGLCFYLLLSSNTGIIQFLILILIFFVYYYLRQIYLGNRGEIKVRWDNLSYYFSFLALFFVFSFIYGSEGSLFSTTSLSIFFIITVLFLTYQVFWAQELLEKRNYVFIFLIGLVLIELAWVFFYLPFSYNIGGLVIAIFYYLILGMVRLHLKGALNKRKIKFYLSLSLGCIALILLTARIF